MYTYNQAVHSVPGIGYAATHGKPKMHQHDLHSHHSCRNVFKAGASHYGVADLQLLAQETHKFESRCLLLCDAQGAP